MKKQVLTLIIGILIGAIITAGIFMIFKKDSSEGRMQEPMGERRSMDGNFVKDGNPPSMEENDQNGNDNETNA